MEVRILNVLLGIWLFVSACVWDHAPAGRVNTWLSGLACTAVALVALRAPRARLVNMVLAVWVFASVIFLPRHGDFELWNNLLVGVAMFFVAGVPSLDEEARQLAMRGA